jgi:LysR family glycine cleavage system transcriptional activator
MGYLVMARRAPPLNWLRSFECAARQLSFTAAGQELHLTQAAISLHVKSLEQLLGQPLFVRLPRSLRLTDAGRAYQRKIAPVLEQIAADTEEIFGLGASDQLTIRVNAAFSVLWLAPRLKVFLAACPGIRMRVSNPVWSLTEMEDGIDFEIRYGRGDWPGLRCERLTRDRIFPVCAPGHPAAAARADDLRDSLLIHVLGYRDGWPEWCAAAGLTAVDARRGLQCDNSIMAYETAATGAGLTIARSSLVVGFLAAGRLVRPFAAEVPTAEDFYLVSPTSAAGDAASAAFRDWLLKEASNPATQIVWTGESRRDPLAG